MLGENLNQGHATWQKIPGLSDPGLSCDRRAQKRFREREKEKQEQRQGVMSQLETALQAMKQAKFPS